MKSNLILFLFALVITLSCNKKVKASNDAAILNESCMKRVLEKDSELGNLRNHKSETMPLSITIENYTSSLEQLNFEDCQKNFKIGFKNHIAAWKKMGVFTKKHNELRGEMHDLFNQIEKSEDSLTFKPLLKSIWDTWTEIEAASQSFISN